MIARYLFLPLALLAGPLGVACQTVALPPPPTPSNVHITTFPLTDTARVDPFAPCCHHPRRLMLSFFQPANCSNPTSGPYMPPATAALHDEEFAEIGLPNGTFEAFRLQTCAKAPAPADHPVLLFSTGSGTSRLVYNVMLQWVASMGFHVVAIDHSYDAPIVVFPDGSVIPQANISLPADLDKLLAVRVADVAFVLDALANSTTTTRLGLPALKTKQVGMFGHSLGGATAALAMLNDSRIVAGLDLDGSIFGAATSRPNKRPYAILARDLHNQTSDATWAAFWQELHGYKLQLGVNGTQHGSFTDYPILAKAAGLDSANIPSLAENLGTIDGVRILRIVRRYVAAFFRHNLQGQVTPLLDGPSQEFPEVTFANASRAAS